MQKTTIVLLLTSIAASAPIGITYHLELSNWLDARNKCRKYGGDLPSFHSEAEWQTAYKNMPCSASFWFGLNDIIEERTFIYSDATPVNYQAWAKNKPSHFSNNDCAITNGKAPFWSDAKCSRQAFFMCKGIKKEHAKVIPKNDPRCLVKPVEIKEVDTRRDPLSPFWRFYFTRALVVAAGVCFIYSIATFIRIHKLVAQRRRIPLEKPENQRQAPDIESPDVAVDPSDINVNGEQEKLPEGIKKIRRNKLGRSDRGEIPRMIIAEQGDEWRAQGPELILKCVAKAKELPECSAFAINKDFGVHFYKGKCSDVEADDMNQWDTYDLVGATAKIDNRPGPKFKKLVTLCTSDITYMDKNEYAHWNNFKKPPQLIDLPQAEWDKMNEELRNAGSRNYCNPVKSRCNAFLWCALCFWATPIGACLYCQCQGKVMVERQAIVCKKYTKDWLNKYGIWLRVCSSDYSYIKCHLDGVGDGVQQYVEKGKGDLHPLNYGDRGTLQVQVLFNENFYPNNKPAVAFDAAESPSGQK